MDNYRRAFRCLHPCVLRRSRRMASSEASGGGCRSLTGSGFSTPSRREKWKGACDAPEEEYSSEKGAPGEAEGEAGRAVRHGLPAAPEDGADWTVGRGAHHGDAPLGAR